MKQVDKSAYSFRLYAHKGRWASYYHQLDEVLAFDPRSVLDVGVGDKVFASYIKNNTDIAYTSIDIADDLKPDIVGSVESLPFPDGSFDIVCAFEVLEHLPFEKLPKALAEIARVAKNGAVITLPHFGPAFRFMLKLPFIPELKCAFKIPFPRQHAWKGQHYWEIGKKGYSPATIRKAIKQHFIIRREFVPFENQYHHFFTLEPMTEGWKPADRRDPRGLVRKAVFGSVRLLFPRDHSGGIILMYHSIGYNGAPFTVKPDEFERQMRFLKEEGFRFLKFSELVERLDRGRSLDHTVCVTFDDGYEDNYTNAFPILQRYGIPRSYFISTDSMGKTREISGGFKFNMMDERMIADLLKTGLVECLPHGHMHLSLGKIDLEEARRDIEASQGSLAAITGKKSEYFAYPYGNHSPELLELMTALGFKAAVGVEEGVVTARSDRLFLPRMEVSARTSFSKFVCKTTRARAYLRLKRLLKRWL